MWISQCCHITRDNGILLKGTATFILTQCGAYRLGGFLDRKEDTGEQLLCFSGPVSLDCSLRDLEGNAITQTVYVL